ncbi:hypothetical protein CDAR_463281 [Caerostris darwini]|uniref:Uncharacterized protein n=1 Tax=Caerostris darwini TaxID=1538125 RepID=A0AAV4UWN6_9ARAC|nr:hypothetical protein CDAR_463281 [Caerostris darwini]
MDTSNTPLQSTALPTELSTGVREVLFFLLNISQQNNLQKKTFHISVEPESNQRPMDTSNTPLQSTALPTELSTGVREVLFFLLNISQQNNLQKKNTFHISVSVEPESNQRPMDTSNTPLQSTALPTELSTGVREVLFFLLNISQQNNLQKKKLSFHISVEPESNQRPMDTSNTPLQSTALPTELSTGVREVLFFLLNISQQNNLQKKKTFHISVEPESNQRPMDTSNTPLQSTALPTELSTGVREVLFFLLNISQQNNLQKKNVPHFRRAGVEPATYGYQQYTATVHRSAN